MSDLHAQCEVLVIGAGPAGLSIGRILAQEGISVRLLERDVIGSTWRNVPPDLEVLSPWWTNALRMRNAVDCNPLAKVPARRFLDHLLAIASDSGFPVEENTDIVRLAQTEAGWQAIARDGRRFEARCIICASGYFSTPRLLEAPFSSDGSVPVLHAGDISDYDKIGERFHGRQVVIVGKRVTAGQLLIELHRRGVAITLSARSPIEFRRHGLAGWVREQAYFVLEAARHWFSQGIRADSYPPMDGGEARRLIQSGKVPVIGRPAAIEDGKLITIEGNHHAADAVILATGYRPTLGFLNGLCDLDPATGLPTINDFEVSALPGVYLLGFDNLHNFRSRYLRGIRSDARLLGELLTRRLRPTESVERH